MYGSAVDTVLHGTAKESFDALDLLKAGAHDWLRAGQRGGLPQRAPSAATSGRSRN